MHIVIDSGQKVHDILNKQMHGQMTAPESHSVSETDRVLNGDIIGRHYVSSDFERKFLQLSHFE